MREVLSVVKKRGAFRFLCVAATMVLVLLFWAGGASEAFYATVRYNRIEKVPGFRFDNLVYAWNKVELDVENTTTEAKPFSGTMLFLDHRGRLLASASLLQKKIAGLRTERYTAYFVKGSGESARRAARIIWDFGAQ